MSGEMRTMTWSFSTVDSEHMSAEWKRMAERCEQCTSPHDHVAHRLSDFMEKAGQAWVSANEDLFRVGLT
jgi:hypothetical protein